MRQGLRRDLHRRQATNKQALSMCLSHWIFWIIPKKVSQYFQFLLSRVSRTHLGSLKYLVFKISIPFRIMWIKTILALSLLVTWIDCAPLDVHGCDSCNTGKNIYPKYYKHWYILWPTQLIGNVDILWGGNFSMMFYSSSQVMNATKVIWSHKTSDFEMTYVAWMTWRDK